MSSSDSAGPDRWVMRFLVTGSRDEVVSAAGLVKNTLLQDSGAYVVASTLARFADLSPEEQDRWRLLVRREADS